MKMGIETANRRSPKAGKMKRIGGGKGVSCFSLAGSLP